MSTEIQQKLARYETFVNERLKPDLEQTLVLRDQVFTKISEYEKLQLHLGTIKEQELDSLTTMVDLGCSFYAQAKVPDTTYIYVSIGYGFHLQLTIDEAVVFIERKIKHLRKMGDTYTNEAAKIRAHIKTMLHAMAEILQLNDNSAPSH
ncbi:Prefoldin subunit-domain-containing protein [Syncephalis fuscata]|nr:Prefoldin subunit-domain-containing protein [Syncephalis fuscata]